MKTYNVCFSREPLVHRTLPNTETVQVQANNIREVFSIVKKKYRGIDVFFIEELITFWKRITRYNKFYYVDKKTGSMSGLKLIFDMNENKYINKYPSVKELIREHQYKKALKLVFNMTIRRHIINKAKGDFRHYKAVVEDYCIKNNLPGIAARINSTRILPATQTARNKVTFDIKHHLEHRDLTGNTKGCGCIYCKTLYYMKQAHSDRSHAWDIARLHRAYHFGNRTTFLTSKGEYFLNLIPVMPSASKRLLKIYSKSNNVYKDLERQERFLRVCLQIPKAV
ncbi:MAG: hypothetical protein ACP5OA_03510 [Candidatus Woesearchaeota archaeon]